jgi:hypothetical protein
MLDRTEKRIRLGDVTARPSDVLGRNIFEAWNHVNKEIRKVGDEINQYANGVLKGQPVDIRDDVRSFFNGLEEQGIFSLARWADDPETAWLQESIGMTPASKEAILNLIDRMRTFDRGTFDALEAHKLKRWMQDKANWDKTNVIKGDVANSINEAIKGFSGAINGKLRQVNPEYADMNDQYAAFKAMQEKFERTMGKRQVKTLDDQEIELDDIDFMSDDVSALSKHLGQNARKIFSNYNSRAEMEQALSEMMQLYGQLGGNRQMNLVAQAAFVDDLEFIFAVGGKRNLENLMERANIKSTQGFIERVKNYGDEKLSNIWNKMNSTDKNERLEALKLFREFIEETNR